MNYKNLLFDLRHPAGRQRAPLEFIQPELELTDCVITNNETMGNI